MGNDNSRLKGLVTDKTSVEANDFWTLYNGESPTTSNEDGRQLLSIFQGETVVNGQLWVTAGPLDRAIKNLMIYRHPYILKYVATWEQGGQKYLATERVRPLATVLSTQSDIQICLGLRTILCSLIFLIEKAMARHLNICTSSVYITEHGSWRLAGFEYVWKCKEVTKSLLDLANAFRYKAAIDPCETKDNSSDSIEQYAFATLCEEILVKCTKSETSTPHIQEFREYCATHLKHKNAQMRPKLSGVLLHPYFNHEFVLIHSFLFELPLKSVHEKQEFFTGLIDRLRYFNEEMVGSQLACDLLSRMVLLDPTAQLCVTPYVLKTKTEHSAALFSNQTYTRHLMPHILKMFRLRDAQIRLILLEYFMEYVRLLSNEELEECILPHLLAGMNDTNDVLVAKTLRCLADLVPILGSATVIGGNRCRLFSDGRPQAAIPDSTTHWVEPRSITPVMGGEVDYMVSSSPLPGNQDISGSFNSLPQVNDVSEQIEMPPRLSPDGGEDDKSAIVVDVLVEEEPQNEPDVVSESVVQELFLEPADVMRGFDEIANLGMPPSPSMNGTLYKNNNDEDDEQWSDWETDELQHLNADNNENCHNNSSTSANAILEHSTTLPSYRSDISMHPPSISSYTTVPSQNSLSDSCRTIQSNASSTSQSTKAPPKINDDLEALDIIVQKTSSSLNNQSSEFDFFKDMEPVIETSRRGSFQAIPSTSATLRIKDEEVLIDASRFAAVAMEANGTSDDGWGVDDDDMNIDANVDVTKILSE